MPTTGLQTVLNRVEVDERLQQEFLGNPFAVLDGCGLTPQEVREVIFWLPVHLALQTANKMEGRRPALFRDRADAGRQLAARLNPYRDANPVVLALPRGGVPVAHEVARALGSPLDVVVARKLGAPGNPEFAFGAIAAGGTCVRDERAVRLLGLTEAEIERIRATEQAEMERRERAFRRDRPARAVADHTMILVDDGVASGVTAQAAARALRLHEPRVIVLAVPACPRGQVAALRADVDDFVCVAAPYEPQPVGRWYDDFTPVTDADVVFLLAAAERAQTGGVQAVEEDVSFPAAGVDLHGILTRVQGAGGIVLFAHGSGSSRHSLRNRFVARQLNDAGLDTLLIDLLTREEEEAESDTGRFRFDIKLLADRLIAATDWLTQHPDTRSLPIGYFGASTGAAAAMVAAAERPDAVHAIVSRGGRPDLAMPSLYSVRTPTLLVVGGNDFSVIPLNQEALGHLRVEKHLTVVPGAGHLFEEPGALEEVARLAADWFLRHLKS